MDEYSNPGFSTLLAAGLPWPPLEVSFTPRILFMLHHLPSGQPGQSDDTGR